MKILYLCRLFDGFETSLLKRKWIPSGVPTIYKLIEKLDKENLECKFVISDLGTGIHRESINQYDKIREFSLEGLKNNLIFIPGEFLIKKKFRNRISSLFIFFYRQISILNLAIKFSPDIIYVDRANLFTGAILSRFFSRKVVLRIMGVYPDMWEIIREKRYFFTRWLYRSNFSHVICTGDGSGGKQWMDLILKDEVKRSVMLNGIDKKNTFPTSFILKKSNKVKILFMGRMEKIKGIEDFIDAISNLKNEVKKKIDIYIVGTGSLNDRVDYLIKSFYLSNLITRIKIIKHDEIKSFIKQFDIYVSMNKGGNISNSNIECFYSGLCCIIPNKDEKLFRDIDLEKYFPKDCLLRLNNEKLVEDLTDKISKLVLNRKIIKKYSKNLKKKSLKIFKDWDFRINKELDLIKKIASH